VYVGGGNVSNVHISSNAVTNITFPFSVSLNSSDSSQQGVLMDLVTRCGLDGSTPQNINFNYYIYPTVRIAGIAITPKISESMSIPCPITVKLKKLVFYYHPHLFILILSCFLIEWRFNFYIWF
jgi:hypothetical protein